MPECFIKGIFTLTAVGWPGHLLLCLVRVHDRWVPWLPRSLARPTLWLLQWEVQTQAPPQVGFLGGVRGLSPCREETPFWDSYKDIIWLALAGGHGSKKAMSPT